MEEIWKVYKDTRKAPNGHLYEVSNFGNVKADGVLIKLRGGYLEFGNHYHVHRAVAELFIPKPKTNKRLCVDHIDGNPHNNKINNLRWVTWSENALNPATHCNAHHHKWNEDEKQRISKNVSEYNSHCCWIHLGDKTKFVYEDYLDYWLDDGWLLGRKKTAL